MNTKELDQDLIALVEKKNILAELDYSDTDYDKIEEKLHELEDDFVEKYGEYLEDALHNVHDEYCPDNDVLLPIAYLANKYIIEGKNEDGSDRYDVDRSQGVIVEADDFPEQISRIVLVPNPTRLILTAGKEHKEVVWKADL